MQEAAAGFWIQSFNENRKRCFVAYHQAATASPIGPNDVQRSLWAYLGLLLVPGTLVIFSIIPQFLDGIQHGGGIAEIASVQLLLAEYLHHANNIPVKSYTAVCP